MDRFWDRVGHTRIPWYALLILILTPIYYRTLLPGLGFLGDSAKFQFVGKILGTAHLPGYPLYTVLNYLFVSVIPKGTLAFRVNLLSTCFSLLAVLVFFDLLTRLRIRPVIAFITVLMYALTYSFWRFSIIAEVYSLNILLLIFVLDLLIHWRQSKANWAFYSACFLYAISFGNHLVMIAFLPSFTYLVWVTDRSVFRDPKKILIVSGFVLLGVSQYLYIVWRTNDPTTIFLETDTNTLMRLWSGVRSTAFKMSLGAVLIERLPVVLNYFWSNLFILLLLALWGVFLVKDFQLNIALMLLLVINTFLVVQIENPEVDGVYLPGFLVVSIYVGFALNQIAVWLSRKSIFTLILFVIPVVWFYQNYHEVDQSQHNLHALIVERILNEVNRNGLIIADDYAYATYLWYYLLGQGLSSRNIYAIPDFDVRPEEIQKYLAGEEGMYIWQQRLTVPPGLPVYTLWKVAPDLEMDGFRVEETGIQYLYRVNLPDRD